MRNFLPLLVAAALASACAPMQQRPFGGTPLPSRYVLNGLNVTPVQQFPVAAWGGLPAVRTLSDISATKELASKFASAARRAADAGNMEVALLNWYAAQHLANQGITIAGATLSLIDSIDANGDARIPARGLAILPTQPLGEDVESVLSMLPPEIPEAKYAALGEGVQVAGGGAEVLSQVIQSFGRTAAPQQRQPATYGGGFQSQVNKARESLPLNTPVLLQGGLYVERKADVFVIYNNTDQPTKVPLSKIGYLPPLEQPSAARKAAAPLIRSISLSYWQNAEALALKRTTFRCEVERPNRVACSGAESTYVDADGLLSRDRRSGEIAYNSNPAYRDAINIIEAAAKAKPREEFRTTCLSEMRVLFNERIYGTNAEIKRLSCTHVVSGTSVTSELYMGETGVVKTFATLMKEKETRKRMLDALKEANAWSDAVSYLPVAGSLEDAAKCVGADTTVVKTIYQKINNPALPLAAKLAGWRPSPPEDKSIIDTAASCLGTVPIVGTAGRLASKGARFLNQGALAKSLENASDLLSTFKNSMNPREFEDAYKTIVRNYPNNKELAATVKAFSDVVQHQDDMSSTMSGIAALKETYGLAYF